MVGSLRPAGYTRESFAGKTAHPLDAARIEALRDFVAQDRRRARCAGRRRCALIDHGKVVCEGGIGVRELGKPEPVDAHTLFMIASNTKGMSTLAARRAGRTRASSAGTRRSPTSIRRSGSAATRRPQSVEVRHLVCACTGLPRKDFDGSSYRRRDAPAADTFAQLAATQPTSKFGEVFQYNNLMASAAGYIGGHIALSRTWSSARPTTARCRSMIFDPLGMRDTTFDCDGRERRLGASPHGDDIDGRLVVMSNAISTTPIYPYRPAGGAWSSPHDMVRYVQHELDQGR